MTHITDINEINFHNLPIMNNRNQIDETQSEVGWFIDRTPDHNLINNISEYDDINFINNLPYIRNQYLSEQFHRTTYDLRNGIMNFNYHIDNDYDYDYHYQDTHGTATAANVNAPAANVNAPAANDEFIPFEPFTIRIDVQEFPVSQEDINCCICMESRENQQICQLNCLHKFCSECTLSHIQRNGQRTSCPLCRTPVTNISVKTQEIRETFI